MKQLMLGNEAIAFGAMDAGVSLISSYPGTPSTEITEYASKNKDIYVEWAPNEKVATEVAIGAAIGGARAMTCMKHVGVNVAADPIFTVAYTGVNGGLVIIAADDPGMHSSQNEQDSRYYAMSAHIPMLEPADSQECYSMVRAAFEMSEKYDTPVFVRLTTRIAHSQSAVELFEKTEKMIKPYTKNIGKYVMMPAMARGRHIALEQRENQLSLDIETMGVNKLEYRDKNIGVICSGAVYQYVREALPNASTLKLGMVYPLAKGLIASFAKQVEKIYVIEELEPIIENQVKAMGISCIGKELFSIRGELNTSIIRMSITGVELPFDSIADLPARPPVLCPGCPHRAVFHTLSKMKLNVTGDIGCYTLGANAPYNAMDMCVCMGASIGMAHGLDRSGALPAQKTVAILGDSTFIHSGITGLINVVYNKGNSTVMILDNSITGMTGHQQNPTTGKDIRGEAAPQINLVQLCEAVGVKDIHTVDPFDMKLLEKTIKDALSFEGVSVIIAQRPCALIIKEKPKPFQVNESCINCGICGKLGCPAIEKQANAAFIDASLCFGCGLCASVCPKKAIVRED